jgi:transcriptional regulator with XRE-family HTH domain
MPRPRHEISLQQLTVMTQREVALHLGISTMRVSQLERSAFKKIRAAFEQQGYEVRKPIIFNHKLLKLVSELERERWLYRILLVDCDLSETKLARLWQAQ